MRRCLLAGLLLPLLLSMPGCAWLRGFAPLQQAPQAPRVLPEEPSLAQVIGAVNQNSGRVHSYYTPNARISTAGLPALRADIALVRPRSFRLRGQLALGLTGPEIDLGSNQEEFWFWLRRAQPPALFYARHDQYSGSAVRRLVPVDPEWLIDALGVTHFDPAGQHRGPRRRRDGRLEIRSVVATSGGEVVKISLIDPVHGRVLEQHMYTPQGERLASAIARSFRYDPIHSISLPRQVEVQMPPAQLNLQIDTGDFQINQLAADPAQVFTRPSYDGFPAVNLAQISPPGNPIAPPGPAPPSMQQARSPSIPQPRQRPRTSQPRPAEFYRPIIRPLPRP